MEWEGTIRLPYHTDMTCYKHYITANIVLFPVKTVWHVLPMLSTKGTCSIALYSKVVPVSRLCVRKCLGRKKSNSLVIMATACISAIEHRTATCSNLALPLSFLTPTWRGRGVPSVGRGDGIAIGHLAL